MNTKSVSNDQSERLTNRLLIAWGVWVGVSPLPLEQFFMIFSVNAFVMRFIVNKQTSDKDIDNLQSGFSQVQHFGARLR